MPLQDLSEFIVSLRATALPPEVLHGARRCVIDWFAATIPGGTVPPATMLAEAFGDELDRGRAVLLPSGRRATPGMAALINGAAAHVLEFDDIFRDAIYHPGAPVISAGSIADGRGMAAALMLGADGVWVGTRFAASEEASIDQSYKQRIIDASETGTLFSKVFNGGWDATGRALRNSTIDIWEAAGRPEAGQRPGEGEVIAKGVDGEPVERYSAIGPYTGMTGDLEGLPNWAGQGVGLINRIQPAAEIVRELTEEAIQVLSTAAGLVQD